ncbi:hypothetical protein NC651_013655 [Populus alba x Populus x berolinensis]|nr:hypothetical protein NC651_013655 [Populus alba x Populus x berolinensis]
MDQVRVLGQNQQKLEEILQLIGLMASVELVHQAFLLQLLICKNK